MKKSFPIALLAIALTVMPQLATPASAHTPVTLLDSDTTPNAGPLLVDGAISFAIQASFTRSGQKKAFRAALKKGDELAVEYLIVDRKPENALNDTKLPQLVITSPSGKKLTIKFNERTKFYYPFLRTNFIYLARYRAPAEAGIYEFVATSRGPAAITLGVGEKEIPGEVRRGSTSTPSATR
jgi:hypothetical protein